MAGLEGEAVWALSVMWTLTALVFAFLLLRLYTRIFCLAAYGVDDHIYVVAFVFLVIFTAFTHVSGTYGFGQTLEEIGDMERIVNATLYECIGQGFAIIGMAIAKAALGAFLLRLVTIRWHQIAIWTIMALVSAASVAQVLCFWLSCRPFAYVYDRRIEGGSCPIDTRPTSYILCGMSYIESFSAQTIQEFDKRLTVNGSIVSTILADFFFALFPWIMVWDLQMPRREKLTIAGSFSLGLIAAAAGIKRTTEVEGLYTANYLRDSVGLIVWSNAEMAITLICIGIPVCRPLYSRIFKTITSSARSTGYQKHGDQEASSSGGKHTDNNSGIILRTIGGGTMDRGNGERYQGPPHRPQRQQGKSDSDSDLSVNEMNLGINGPFTKTRVGAGSRGRIHDNTSDEEILGTEYHAENAAHEEGDHNRHSKRGQITVTETVRVDRS